MPDIELGNLRLTRDEDDDRQLKEADLAGHLSNTNGEEGGDEAEGTDSASADGEAERDYALSEALNLLKGLSILGSAPAA